MYNIVWLFAGVLNKAVKTNISLVLVPWKHHVNLSPLPALLPVNFQNLLNSSFIIGSNKLAKRLLIGCFTCINVIGCVIVLETVQFEHGRNENKVLIIL